MIQPTPKECFLVGLTWYHSASGMRKPCFPSWTWAGWNGQVSDYLLGAPDRETAGNQASWTWAGWNGQVSRYLLGVPDREASSNQQYSQLSQVDVFLEIQAGEPLCFPRWRELSYFVRSLNDSKMLFISIESDVFTCSLQYHEKEERKDPSSGGFSLEPEAGYYPTVEVSDGWVLWLDW